VIFTLLSLTIAAGCGRNAEREKHGHQESGQRYFKEGKYAEAAVEFRNALHVDPRSVMGYLYLGRAYCELQQWSEAAASLGVATELDPENLQARLLLAEVYLNEHNYSGAENEAALILQKQRTNAAAHQARGAALVASGQTESALESFQEIARLLPDDPSSYINLAIVEIGLEHTGEAEKHLRKALQIAPHAILAYLNLANLYRRENREQEAEAVLWDGVKNNPEVSALYVALADILYALGKDPLEERVVNDLREKQRMSADAELAIGDLYFKRRSLSLAENAFQRGLELAPERTDLKQRLVEIYLSQANLKSAALLNGQILRTDPANLESHINQARILLSKGKNEEAVTELRKQLALLPGSSQAHYFLGYAYLRTNGPALAESEFQRALDLDPNFFPALRSLAELQLSRGAKGAVELANRCVSLRPLDSPEHLLLGTAYFQEGEISKARAQFMIAQQLDARDPRVPYSLGLCSMNEHKLDQARQELESALRLNPTFTHALGELAELDVQAKRRGRALSRVRRYLAANPNSADAHLILGSLYTTGRECDEAKAEFERAIQINPNLISAHLDLGRIYQQTGKSDLAVRQYERAIVLQPHFAPLITLLGDIYLERGDLATAQKYFEQALAAKPDFAVAASNLAQVYAQQGSNLDLALNLARSANRQLPELDSVVDTLGWVHYRKGQYSDAVPLLRECVQNAPRQAIYRYHLGMALVSDGQRDEGRRELQAALRLKLSGGDASQARDALAQLK